MTIEEMTNEIKSLMTERDEKINSIFDEYGKKIALLRKERALLDKKIRNAKYRATHKKTNTN